ncbi:MAG: HDIG domain-containing protein [Firmicutes bacterium]|nr:HDIG domain-containing protein [Bacillota bacterium]
MDFVRLHLGAGGQLLFFQMDPADQRHALNVAKAILAKRGYGDDPPAEEMIQAALLHDVGKVAGDLTPLGRLFVGFVRRIAPSLRARWADRAGNAFRRACYVDLVHARRGAYMARAFGVADEVVAAIRGHHDPPRPGEPKLLTYLREADGEN